MRWTHERPTLTFRAMNRVKRSALVMGFACAAMLAFGCASSQTPGAEEPAPRSREEAKVDPLPSWNDTVTKARIIAFVEAVTDEGDPGYVEPGQRVATFDNDGTLWVEQPVYAEVAFALKRVRDLAQVHPEWKTQYPFKAVLEGDKEAFLATGTHGLVEVIVASHTGMSTTLFDAIAREWVRDAVHPELEARYVELFYQPQIELLRYLEENYFKTVIVSGGSVEFIRAFAEEVYEIPPERVIGTSITTRYELQGGKPSLLRLPEIDFVDDKSGKPVGIHKHVGQRPILAFGNSDGDFEMLQWTTAGSGGTRLGLILHHDDAEREYAYDRESQVGRLDRALDAAASEGWIIVSMKEDWDTVFE